MNIKLIEFNSEHYAANLTQKANTLKWESVGATHFMLVRSEFGCDIRLTEQLIQKLQNLQSMNCDISCSDIKLDDYYFTIFPRSGVNVYSITVKPAAYAIFACCYDGDILTIYNPTDACFYQCPVVARLRISVKQAPVKEKKLIDKIKSIGRKKAEECRYYNVKLPEVNDYKGDFLCYGYTGCEFKFPITSQMLGKTVLIPDFNGEPPKIECLAQNAYKLMTEK